jgi:hypothetical protein
MSTGWLRYKWLNLRGSTQDQTSVEIQLVALPTSALPITTGVYSLLGFLDHRTVAIREGSWDKYKRELFGSHEKCSSTEEWA